MKYLLELPDKSPSKNLLLWSYRYLRYKASTLSNRFVKSRELFSQILEEFDNFEDIEKLKKLARSIKNAGISINIDSYPVIRFNEFFQLKKLESLRDIDDALVVDFLVTNTTRLTDSVKRSYRIAMLDFFKFINNNKIKDNFLFEMCLKVNFLNNKTIKPPAFLNEKEIYKFMRFLEIYSNKTIAGCPNKRNALLIKIIIFTGMKCSEAMYIKLNDISADRHFLIFTIRCKGGSIRNVVTEKKNL